jgi:hypothetical protein
MMCALLVCPDCASEQVGDERFCGRCGMPLVRSQGGEARVTERQRHARKINPLYAEGALVRAMWARNQAEAELVAGMLLEEGVPSLLRRPAGFDVPDFMAAGPREVLVPQSGLQAAREVLLQGELAPRPRTTATTPRPTRLLAAMLLAIALVAIVLFMATHVWD